MPEPKKLAAIVLPFARFGIIPHIAPSKDRGVVLINSFCTAIERIQRSCIVFAANRDVFFHRAGYVEHQRGIDRNLGDLRLALAGDERFQRQLVVRVIHRLVHVEAVHARRGLVGRIRIILCRACCNRYHGQNHNNSQQKR